MPLYDEATIERVRESVPISIVIGQRVTWDHRKSRPARGDFWAPCPLHGERSPSFHCEDDKGRFHCFGCGASGNVFTFLMQADGMTFPAAVEHVASLGGVALESGQRRQDPAERERWRREMQAKRERERQARAAEDAKRSLSAGRLWKATRDLAGTAGEAYLIARGLPAWGEPNLRFHAACWHELARVTRPAVIGRVQGPAGNGIAVWRIFVKPDGSDKLFGKSDEHSAKLGRGPAAGGAVRLGGDAEWIGIGEGIETCRAAFLLDGRCPVWAGLSTSGIQGFEPPPFVKRISIYPDGDKPRRRDGVDFGPPGLQAALDLKARMDERGIRCTIIEPPPAGMDYLDLWNARAR